MKIDVDVSPLVPEARAIVARCAEIYFAHTGSAFIGLVIHGSALKGGFIPHCSDIDFQLYLHDTAFDANGNLALDMAMAIQRDLSQIEIAPFSYIQCYPRRVQPTPDIFSGELGPIPGTYHVLLGRLPVPEATAEQTCLRARRDLRELKVPPFNVSQQLLDYGEGRLKRAVRLLCTDVGPTLYNVVTCLTNDPLRVWRLPKLAAIELLPIDEPLAKQVRAFYGLVHSFYANETNVELGLETIRQGIRFMAGAKDWYNKFSNE